MEHIDQDDQAYTPELYAEIMAVLTARESVSSIRDRLTYYFQARGITVTDLEDASNIYLGSDLCS